MLQVFEIRDGTLREVARPETPKGWIEADWVDLHDPTREEIDAIEAALGVELDTPETDEPFQQSSRLKTSRKQLTMTASVLTGTGEDDPRLVPVTFIRTKETLITLSRGAPRGITSLIAECETCFTDRSGPADVFAAILDMFIDHADNVLDAVGKELDRINSQVFQHHVNRSKLRRLAESPRLRNRQLERALTAIGPTREILVKLRRSIVSFRRMVAFLRDRETNKEMKAKLEVFEKDLTAIDEGEEDLSAAAGYLLDGIIGFIGLLQNKVINILTLVSLILTPPVVVASIYGMNFKHIPELDWAYGYPYALGLMAVLTIGMYLWVRMRGL